MVIIRDRDPLRLAIKKIVTFRRLHVGYTCRHLFQRIEEHKHSAIGKHLLQEENLVNLTIKGILAEKQF